MRKDARLARPVVARHYFTRELMKEEVDHAVFLIKAIEKELPSKFVLKFTIIQSRRITNYQVIKHFVCDDGSGEFSLKMQVLFDRRGNNYNWVIVSGTGRYEKLHGVGQGAGPQTDYGVLDLFEGVVHID